MKVLIERPENPDQSGRHRLLVHPMFRPLGIHSSKPLIAIFNSQIQNSCSLQGTSVWRVSFVSALPRITNCCVFSGFFVQKHYVGQDRGQCPKDTEPLQQNPLIRLSGLRVICNQLLPGQAQFIL